MAARHRPSGGVAVVRISSWGLRSNSSRWLHFHASLFKFHFNAKYISFSSFSCFAYDRTGGQRQPSRLRLRPAADERFDLGWRQRDDP